MNTPGKIDRDEIGTLALTVMVGVAVAVAGLPFLIAFARVLRVASERRPRADPAWSWSSAPELALFDSLRRFRPDMVGIGGCNHEASSVQGIARRGCNPTKERASSRGCAATYYEGLKSIDRNYPRHRQES